MKLIIGLGNIGKEYEQTRHNVGFMCVNRFAEKHSLSARSTPVYSYLKYKSSLLIMPKTFMNNSGDAYKSALHKYHSFDDVLVVSDDIELPVGKIRIRNSGGDGGHNGLKSIIRQVGSDEVSRIRIGIGRSDDQTPKDYVLDNFTSEELKTLDDVLTKVTDWLDLYIRYGISKVLDEYSKWKKKPIPSTEGGINRPKEDNV